MRWPTDRWLRRANWVLLAVIICSNGYLLLAPVWPAAKFTIKTHLKPLPVVTYEKPNSLANVDRSHNQLLLPTIGLTQPILEGTDPKTVNHGIWRLPISSQPDQQSNTVLVGHRFTYSGVSVLYLLDHIKQNDEEFVVWDHKIYAYKVDKITVVTPDVTAVEDPSDQPELTIYSCTPLWSTSHRLVVQASLEKIL